MNDNRPQNPPTREELRQAPLRLLSQGRWGNADLWLFDGRDGRTWVIKDFSRRSAPVRKTWGAYNIRREFRMLQMLRGLEGVPQGVFLLDDAALGYLFVPGRTLKQAPRELTPARYFHELEDVVRRMHARGVVHLDVRYKRNVLVTDAGHPLLIDFQTARDLARVPRGLRRHLKNVDLSGVYKHWHKRDPSTLDPERQALLFRLNRLRKFWVLKGYAGVKSSAGVRKKRAL